MSRTRFFSRQEARCPRSVDETQRMMGPAGRHAGTKAPGAGRTHHEETGAERGRTAAAATVTRDGLAVTTTVSAVAVSPSAAATVPATATSAEEPQGRAVTAAAT